MKLAKKIEEVWHYELEQHEGELLLQLLQNFPLSELRPAKVSHEQTPAAIERQSLLNESLAAHREDLKRSALSIAAQLGKTDSGYALLLDSEQREILIQILNDIRVGAWRALGEPENLDQLPKKASMAERMKWHLMHLAGHFEVALVESSC